ncbi:MAG: DUF1993 domain-containing protein [Novosphingobium sp.]
MSLSLHQASVPTFIAMLTNIKSWLDKASAQQDEGLLIEARLAPEMFALARQVQIASDTAKGAAARLAAVDAPAMPDTEASFADLKARCDKTITYLQSIEADAYSAGETREIVITFPNGSGLRFDGKTFLTGYALPNFYFHVAMVYAILRNQGVALGKQDFLAHLAPNMFAPPA